MGSEAKAKSPICVLIETDGCQSSLSLLNTFGPEGANMTLALSVNWSDQSQTLREEYDYTVYCMPVKKY